MARSILEIEQEIIIQKNADPILAVINSTSKVAIWRLWVYIVASAIYTLEMIMDNFRTEIEELASKRVWGTAKWYADMCYLFQYGDVTTVVNGLPKYLIEDETKRIIKRASVNDTPYGVAIKVAKENSGNLEPLSSAELVVFKSYMNEIKFAGVHTSIISLDADILKPYLVIYYDGEMDLPTLKTSIEDKVNEHLKRLAFDGVFSITKLIDNLQSVISVNDIQLLNCYAKANTAVTFLNVDRIYNTTAGYLTLQPIGYTSSDTRIEYIAQ